MKTRLVIALAIAASAGIGASRVIPVVAAQSRAPAAAAQTHDHQSEMPAMMKMHEQMLADMKAADARLDGLVKQMNAATGNAERIAAVAAVVTELAAQHRSMRGHMEGMHHQMMMSGRAMMMNK